MEKCGMGYPNLGLPCVRSKGHQSPTSICFNVDNHGNGTYLYQDGIEPIGKDTARWPKDVITDL